MYPVKYKFSYSEVLFALLHEMKDFEIIRRGVGEKIFENTVTEIRNNGVGLKDLAGKIEFHSRKALKIDFDEAIQKETCPQ